MKQWFQPSHHVLVLFLAATLVLASTLGWLGWRLLEQDRALEEQRLRERLENAADLITATLRSSLSEIEQQLAVFATVPETQIEASVAPYASRFAGNALVVVFRSGEIDAYPPDHLLYYPFTPEWVEPSAGVFATGEVFEFQQKNYKSAIATFTRLARADDSAVRAGALMRLGRTLRKAGQRTAALDAYEQLAQLGDALVGGLPAELVARYARCAVLADLEQQAALEQEARAFFTALHAGRWRITHGVYQFYAQAVQPWLSADPEPNDQPKAQARAAGVESLWQGWQRIRQGDGEGTGHRTIWASDHPVFLVWRSTPEQLVGFVAGPDFFEQQWLSDLAPMLQRQGVELALADATGRSILAPFEEPASQQAVRTPADTQLPWTLRVVSADPRADLAQRRNRRRLLLAGLALVALVVGASLYFMARALTREFKVARLQSDFVSAVSHEFRTPLTSLRQLTEMLAGGRVSSEERRQKYYQVLLQESQRLHRLVESLLDFGRMEAGAQEYRPEPLDASTAVRDVVDAFQKEVEERGYCIELNGRESEAVIQADREAFHRALWNLLDNAVKYSPASKTVWVDVDRRADKLAIRVRDRGLGIPSDEQKEIFTKFVRGAGATASSTKGTGIGLAMVRHIVEDHGGTITVESEPGAGSTFTLLWPLAD